MFTWLSCQASQVVRSHFVHVTHTKNIVARSYLYTSQLKSTSSPTPERMRGFSRGLTAFCLLIGAYARVGALGALVHTPGRVRGGISIDWCIIRQTNILEVNGKKMAI